MHRSLVDRFDADGKRWIIAVANPPSMPDPRALTEEERPILHYVAMGRTNKLIAYELGAPEGTVATRIVSIRRKLGLRTRAEIVDYYHALRRATFALADAGDAKLVVGEAVASGAMTGALAELTSAEREVAKLAARGLTNDEIAGKRRCSVRTVANLLGRAYRKLGLASRTELPITGL